MNDYGTRNVAERYELSFQNCVDPDGIVEKYCMSSSALLDRLLYEHLDIGAKWIEGDILPTILNAINGTREADDEDYQLSSETVSCFYFNGEYRFHDYFKNRGNTGYIPPEFVMPAEDLYQVFKLWSGFIIRKPAYGTKLRFPFRAVLQHVNAEGWIWRLFLKFLPG